MNEYLAKLFIVDRNGTFKPAFDGNRSAFSLLYTDLDIPAISHFAEQVLSVPNSPLFPLLQMDRDFQNTALFTSPLYRIEPFRKEVIKELQDGTFVDNSTSPNSVRSLASRFHQAETAETDLSGGQSSSPSSADLNFDVRICDVVAAHIARLGGAPDFHLSWALPDRNAAIRRQVSYLNQFGAAIGEEGNITFPRLDHPATPDDVTADRAIFSLAKYNLPTRVIPLGEPPLMGQTTQPINDAGSTVTIAAGTPIEVCQAEAALANGVWHKFYGVVSAHDIRMVPDTDVKASFPAEWFVSPLLEAFLQGSSTFSSRRGVTTIPDSQDPIPMRIVLVNYSPQPVPIKIGADPRMLPVTMSMSYASFPDPPLDPRLNRPTFYNPDRPTFPRSSPTPIPQPYLPVPLTPLPSVSPSPNTSQSPPGATSTIIPPYGSVILSEFNLRSMYNISQPGSYLFKIGNSIDSGNNVTYHFIVIEPTH